MALKVLYRISDGGNPKVKLPTATKQHCLENAISIFGKENFFVFADNCGAETLRLVSGLGINPIEIKLGNALSWRHVVQFAIDNLGFEEMVYLLEDDYLHKPNAREALLEALQIADYATLYDHPDKYMSHDNGGLNPYIQNGAEQTMVWLTKSAHWKQTNSTTMTFAAKVSTLKEDHEIWWEFTSKGFPNDFGAFQRLQGLGNWENKVFGKKRILVSSLPGLSSHGESAWLSPLTDWETT